MLELIFDNLGIVVFLVLALGVRVLQARVKARANRKAEPQVFASALEPDEDDEEDDEIYGQGGLTGADQALVDYSRTRGASAYAVELAGKKTARPAEDRLRFEALPGLPAAVPAGPAAENFPAAGSPAEQAAPFPPAEKPQPPEPPAVSPAAAFQAEPEGPSGRVSQGPEKSGAFFPGLERLSPPQQAVLWAEILGKPPGMG
jgi:hypothetical protein